MLHGLTLPVLITCTEARWSPVIGDPTVIGWVTVAAYAAAAALALAVAASRAGPGERGFWLMLTAALAFLCVNKQLDLQSALTAAGRCAAQLQGWYAARKTVQIDFIAGLIAASLLLLALVLWRMRRHLRRTWMAIFGFAFILGFVAVRAVSFHHVDRMIGIAFGDLQMNAILELSGIAMIALNAAVLLVPGPRAGA